MSQFYSYSFLGARKKALICWLPNEASSLRKLNPLVIIDKDFRRRTRLAALHLENGLRSLSGEDLAS